jgi:ABC-type nitrate/sulfonate/bicarbonate transport system substrate-binding protein
MARIRWGNVSIALIVVVVLGYVTLALVGIARPPDFSALLGRVPESASPPTTLGQAAATPASAAPLATGVGPHPAEPAETAPPVAVPTAASISVPDNGLPSEVAVPESQGQFPLGYVTVAFDKEFPPYSPVVMLYQEKLAEKRGLGIHFVPFDIEDRNRIAEFRRAELLQSGGFDILLTTMNSYALWGGPDVARVTAIIGESAGADKAVVQGSSVKTFNDLYGKAIAYSDSSVSEYLLYYMLRAGGVPAQAVIRFGHENLNQAVRRYSDRQAHAVVGWTSSDLDVAMKRPDSKVLMTSDQFRVTTDVIVTGTKALQTKPEAIQAFHDAWFESNKIVFEQPERAAASMNAWNGTWTGVQTLRDLNDALGEFAQATLADNSVLMTEQNLPLLHTRYKEAQSVWLWGGREVRHLLHDAELATAFEPSFVRKSGLNGTLMSTRPPVNPTFHLTAQPQVKGLSPDEQARLQTVAVLDLQQVQFAQGSIELTARARQDIEASVIPVLRNTVGTYLKIDGSAAWPEKKGLNEAAVNSLAFERARSIQDYIIKYGVPVERLILGTTLPRCRECKDAAQVQQDNRAVFSLTAP